MRDEKVQAERPAEEALPVSLRKRIVLGAKQAWGPVGTVVAVLVLLLMTWHVINGDHGVSVWQQKRAEDRQLQIEIQNLEKENSQLRLQVERLKNDPDAIEHEAREKLHYAKPGEVIYTLPAPSLAQPTGAGK